MIIIRNTIITVFISVVFLFLLYVIYPNIYFVPYFSYLINDNRQSLYKTPTETINIRKQECPKQSYTTIELDHLQLCLDKNIINEIKTIKDAKMITTKTEGKQVVLMGSVGLNDLMDEFNKYPNEAKFLMSYESLFEATRLKSVYSFELSYLNATPDDLSFSNTLPENILASILLLMKSGDVFLDKEIYKLNISNNLGFQYGKALNSIVKVHLFDHNNKRHFLIFGMKYTQSEINNMLSRITIAPNNQINPTAMTYGLSSRPPLTAAGY